MLRFKVNAAKLQFFNRPIVDAVDRATVRVLSRFGAFVRTRARGLIRSAGKKGRPSKPGQPPKSHTGLLKRFIFFVFDATRRSVVVGPAKLNAKGVDVPSTLEHGGEVDGEFLTTEEAGRNERGQFQQGRSRWQKKRIKIEARPFMGPAYEKEQPKLAGMWRNSVSK